MKFPLVKFWTTMGLACGVGLMMSRLVWAQTGEPQAPIPAATPTPQAWQTAAISLSLELPAPTYAKVITGNVPVYRQPADASQGDAPVRRLAPGYVWVSLDRLQPVEFNEKLWYAINPDEYVQADYLEPYPASTFQGRTISAQKTFAWIVFDAWTAPAPGEIPGETSQLLERYSFVEILDVAPVDDREWYQVADGHWLEQGMVGVVRPKPRPAGVGPEDKWIEVDLYEQTLAAYAGDRMLYATLISSGLPWWKTEPGLFRVWVKIDENKMTGRAGYADYYFLEDVPWTLYFNHDFALHGAYWHDRFGIRHSHGCVNLSVTDAQWLFEWSTPVSARPGWKLATEAEPGTWVWVHEESEQGHRLSKSTPQQPLP